jgi:DNA mismatch repair protein MutL
MGNIILLDDLTINKIAAGEVVDRPSSIVKELIENSIDANAKNILVEIKNGGITYIKISDDGDGFKSDDVEIAFERHATSKIRQESDILKITSMGFRGEALASIAAISKVTLITMNKDEKVGTKLVVEAGNYILKEKCSSNKGSTLIIKDIFYNTPARYKFLKKDYTESSYIEEVIIRTAIANPHISFKYINNGKIVINTKGDNDINSTIYNIFGKEVLDNIINIDSDFDGIKVNGVIGTPKISRSTRSNEYIYINSRYIKNKTITSAIEKGYEQKLPINRYPFALINVQLKPDTVDVNVHPAKLEVKFEDENKVFEAVYYSIKNALNEYNKNNNPFTIIKTDMENSLNIESFKNNDEVSNINLKIEESILNIEENKNSNINVKDDIKLDEKQSKLNENFIFNYEVPNYVEENILNDNNVNYNKYSNYKYIGSAFDTYILITINDILYLIDQHAAHERLLYENIKNKYNQNDIETQILMIPIIIDLKNYEYDFIKQNIVLFEKTGYVLEEFGKNSYKIIGIPNLPEFGIDSQNMFMDILDNMINDTKTEFKEKESRFLYTLACKAAIKGNMSLDSKEHINLIDEMLKLDNPFTCPHGRPTAYEISKYDIERNFRRK